MTPIGVATTSAAPSAVPDSRFFRDPDAFDALAAWAVPTLAARAAAERRPVAASPLRILCAPCGGGEEAYSIVLALATAGIRPERVRVDAFDRDPDAVERARIAVYGPDTPRHPLLHPTAEGWAVAPAVRSAVRVRTADLLDSAVRATGEPYDAIVCRDRLVHLDADAQTRALAVLDELLAVDGLLVVGAMDRFAVRRAGFRLAGFATAYAYGSPHSTGPIAGAPVVPVGRRTTPFGMAALKARPTPVRPPWERTMTTPLASAALAVPFPSDAPHHAVPSAGPSTTAPSPASAESELARAERLADAGQLREAAAACEAQLRVDPRSVAALALLGLVSDALGDHERATDSYRRVLALDPRHPDALLHLALVTERSAAAR